jgi:ribosome recycling factor
MVTLNLTEEARNILIKTLEEYLGELRMEIRDTEKWEYKEGLKKEEAALNKILTDLLSHK